ncbi:MAG: Asp-tRNA(Asn)/Glu-tRNA(Gln) amidotransferase subunit GatB [bacterium]
METQYFSAIGLEIHAELKTNSKMFCGCKNDPDEKRPNVNICPVCMAHPGAIPVPNKSAMKKVAEVGLAIGGTIADFTEFDRKNYFYPDIPKGYQISQYKYPIVSGGELAGMTVTRIHLEEDTGTSKHDRGDYSLVDYNRAGVPLMELVTDTHVFDSMEEAAKIGSAFGKEYQLLLQYLGVSEANMEKGEMRVEVNISITNDKNKLGTKVEVKNLNSFRSAERAIMYELNRMKDLYEEGRQNEIVQETRGWNEAKQSTYSQRTKESAQDYRYFPDPDIPKFKLTEMFDLEEIKKGMPELPKQKRERFAKDFGIKAEDIESYINDRELGAWFEKIAHILGSAEKVKVASNYITSDFLGLKKNNSEIKMPSAENFAELITLVTDGKVSSRAAKDILAMIVINDASPLSIATEKDLLQKNDEGALKEIASKIISTNEKIVADYKGGKETALMSLVGQIMKETKGSANPAMASKILKELLG